ncbi:alpha-1,6-glucosidase domain-containing protein [Cognatiluteimonas profundi]|uniref:alpha-1,6-glucosidase domain-containing protein n=1 Tax=Cognatiluteimonas profundi TaxID=2594501 RepID=UPI001E5EC521|nr:alpha-1,6-glucosidase domain-containing protein [Lysobacter profundi]
MARPARLRPRSQSLLVILGLALAGTALADGHPSATELACDAAESAQVIAPAARSATDARAYWLDDRHLQWPHAQPGRFALYHSAQARLVATTGARVAGSDRRLPLTLAQAVLPAEREQRFHFIGAGPRLALSDRDASVLRGLLDGQWLLVREADDGRVLDATGVQLPGLLDALTMQAASRFDLGVHVATGSTTFNLWAPTARAVSLCLHDTGTAPATRTLALQRDMASGVWSVRMPVDLRGRYYTYLVTVFVPGVGMVRNRVTDPYSTSLTTDSRRSAVADLDDPALQPPGWTQASRPAAPASMTDMVIYELHVRDFSASDPGVPAAHRGKYLAFTDAGSRGMQHLRALAQAGLTDVHLLPVFDFASVPESGCVTPAIPHAAADSAAQQAAVGAVADRDCFNWGYDPFHFGAPEGSYASDAADGGVRIREFRAMVMALHAAGLRVGMDVVYNHTSAAGQDAHSVLDRIVPGYYQRLDATGQVEHSTCCANTATENAMMARLMINTAVSWATHYGIDSFRFDLMGHQPRAAMEALQRRVDAATGRHVPLIGEGWNFGEIANGARFVQAAQGSLAGSGIATFSDRARDAIRGGGCCDSGEDLVRQQGYINGLLEAPNAMGHGASRADLLRAADLVRVGLAGTLRDVRMRTAGGADLALSAIDYKGAPAGYAAQPGEVVNYVENHDNATLFDIDALRLPRDTSPAERARVQLLGAALVAFSQGIAYYHAGIDLLRSKSLDGNSFDSGDWFNRIDWTGTDNGFGAGLPPAADNAKNWPLQRPVLADAAIKPSPRDIAWMRDAFRDLLRIRASSTLFRMRSADDIAQRLAFRNVGPEQNAGVVVAHLDGRGYPGAGFSDILYLVNVSPGAQVLALPDEARKPYVLHPVQRAPDAADRRPLQASVDAATGRFSIPARTAVVYVIP